MNNCNISREKLVGEPEVKKIKKKVKTKKNDDDKNNNNINNNYNNDEKRFTGWSW